MSIATVRPAKIHHVSSTIIPKRLANTNSYPSEAMIYACTPAIANHLHLRWPFQSWT